MKLLATSGLAAVLAAAVPAQTLMPGSVLVFPCIKSDATAMTVVTVTNKNPLPMVPGQNASGATLAYFNYVLATPNPNDLFHPLRCEHFCIPEYLTPADTVTVNVACHSPANPTCGYLVVYAVSPITGQRVSHNHLIGSSMAFDFLAGAIYQCNAIPFCSPVADGMPTEIVPNGQLDFDGVEYNQMHCELYLDHFIGASNIRLALADFSGLPFGADVTVDLSVWNDNERALSYRFTMSCWFKTELSNISTLFTQAFLAGVQNDPAEFDFNCDGLGDFETGWVKIRAVQARIGSRVVVNPPLLGLVSGGPLSCPDCRLLFGSKERCNGRFP